MASDEDKLANLPKFELTHRTVYAIVKDRTGEIEALCLSRRDCEKVLRGPSSAGGPERIEVLENVGWMTWEQWQRTPNVRK